MAKYNSPAEVEKTLESYKHIELTQDETNAAILAAKIRKDDLQRMAAREARAAHNRAIMTQNVWTPDQTAEFAKWRANGLKIDFRIDPANQSLFDLLCLYFSRDEMFLRLATEMDVENPSLTKGLLLFGSPGTGKTTMMKIFGRNQRQGFAVIGANTIANHFAEHGNIDVFVDPDTNATGDVTNFYQKFRGLCIDDMGTEEIKNHFGNKVNVIGQLMERKYERGHVGEILHATTNLNAGELRSFYGDRVASRMREIFNIIGVDGEDRRK